MINGFEAAFGLHPICTLRVARRRGDRS